MIKHHKYLEKTDIEKCNGSNEHTKHTILTFLSDDTKYYKSKIIYYFRCLYDYHYLNTHYDLSTRTKFLEEKLLNSDIVTVVLTYYKGTDLGYSFFVDGEEFDPVPF